VFSKK
jgi:hypothetical protein